MIPLDPAGVAACPGCGSALDLHQPQPSRPDRFLATCDDCGAWLIFDPGRGPEWEAAPDARGAAPPRAWADDLGRLIEPGAPVESMLRRIRRTLDRIGSLLRRARTSAPPGGIAARGR